jgi:head-tail adaptor
MNRLPESGELQRRITIKLQTDVPNAGFGTDQTFDTGIERWSKVEPIYGLAIRAGMNTGEVPTHLFWIRYGPDTQPEDFTQSHVIEWRGRRYRVLDAINVGDAQRFTRISAKDLGAFT